MPYAAPNLLADTASDVYREIPDILIGHAELDSDHKDIVARKVCLFESADFLNDAALKHANNLPAVVEIAGEPVELPRKNPIGVTLLNPPQHCIEGLSPRLLRALALSEGFDDGHAVLARDAVQFRKLGINGKHLTVLVLGRFAAIDEILKHGQSLTYDITNCEDNMKPKPEKIFTKQLLKALRGCSREGRVLHRLHSIALVLQGFSASATARIYRDSPRAVAYWVKRFKAKGLDGLREEERPGRPAKLNRSQMKLVQLLLTDCRRKGKLLTAKMISDYILQKFGVTLTVRQCERIMRRLSA